MIAAARPLRLLLGLLFVAAGVTKLVPAEHRYLFEMAVSAHGLLPPAGVIWAALLIPPGEIVLGAALAAGRAVRWTAPLAALVLSFFLSLMFAAYFRGIQADCGCFGFGEPIGPWTLARDSALFAVAVYVGAAAWVEARRRRRGSAATAAMALAGDAAR